MMNKLLVRQINKHLRGTQNIPEDLKHLFEVISESYDHYEKDRKMLERAIELTSKEMLELNQRIHIETEESNKGIVTQLKESLEFLNNKKLNDALHSHHAIKLEHIAELLKEETGRRKQAEQERTQREAHLKASQRIAHVGSWELDLTNLSDISKNKLFWSEETYRIFGYEPYSVPATNELFFERVHPDDREAIITAVGNAITKGTIYDIEHRIICPNGKQKIVHERSEIIYDATGRPQKMIGTVQDITRRKISDEKLQRVNEELRTLTENMQEVFYSVDMADGKLLYISAACENVYGFTREEFFLNNNLWFDCIVDEDKARIADNYAVLAQGLPLKQEYRIRRKDGRMAWLESKMEPKLEDGKLIRLIGITSDITQRKEAEQALKDSEHKFRSLISNSSDAIIVVDESLTITYASDSLYRVTGYKPEEIVGLPTLSLAHPDEKELITAFLQEVLNSRNTPKTLLYKTRKADGSYIWCERVTINLLHDPAIKGIVSNFRDVSERMKYEETLRKSEHKFRTMIEHSADVIIILDKDFTATYCSDTLLKVTGYVPQEVLGKKCIEFVYEDDKHIYNEWMQQVLSHPSEPKQSIYRVLKKDQTVIWTERVAVNLLHDPAIEGVILNFRDVTARVVYEQALKDSNEELKKTNAELDKFVYSVSHDLRAPLASVLGIIDIAGSETKEENIKEYLSMVGESVIKLDTFIQDILDYSRNSRTDVRTEQIDFNRMLDEIISTLRYMSEGQTVTISRAIHDNYEFYSDPGRLNIIFSNLISNAIRYRNPEASDPFVFIEVIQNKDHSIISIRDNGIGIKHENQEKVFDMFFREAKSSTGSGLGLYIVKEAVEKLNGKLSLISEPGKGTEFQICIPNKK